MPGLSLSRLAAVGRTLRRRPAGAAAHPGVVLAAFAVELVVWGGDGLTRIPGLAPQAWLVPLVEIALVIVLLTGARAVRRCYLVVWFITVALAVVCVDVQPFAGVLIMVHRIAHDHPRRTAWPYAALTVAPWTVNTINASVNTSPYVGGPAAAVVTLLLWSVITVVVWMAARYGWGLNELAAAREAAAVERGRLALQEQRLRLAREIHDVVSHSVSAMILQAAGAKHSLAPEPRVRAVLATIETTGTDAMQELRGLLSLLGPAAGTEAPELTGDVAAAATDPAGDDDLTHLEPLLATTRACGIDVALTTSGTMRPLGRERGRTGYRVVQEGLTNVMRHAGTGSRATVEIAWEATAVTISVHSIATAAPSTPLGGSSGRGLTGLRTRLGQLGGSLEHGPDGPGRHLLRARLPYPTSDPGRDG